MSEIEDDLFNMLKHFSSGKGIKFDTIAKGLMASVEINTLKNMQGELSKMNEKLNKRIEVLSKQTARTSAMNLDPFSILGVRPDASEEEVKKAYKAKAAEVHPDKGGTNEQMILVNAAFEAIKRAKGWS